jgi:DHA2 family methylenomycin A resistance protein-like MFS transporter
MMKDAGAEVGRWVYRRQVPSSLSTAGSEKIAARRASDPLALVAVGIGIFVFAHDFVAVGIAIPAIQSHFSVGLQAAQWALTLFSIGIAVAVVPAGRMVDAIGPRNGFLLGVIGFGAAAAIVSLAPAVWVVLAARAVQGLAGGVLWIAAIPLVFAAVGAERPGRAGAFLIGISGLGTALGPIDAGLLIEWLSWRAVFALDVILCALVVAITLRSGPPRWRGAGRAVEWPGVANLAATLMALLVTLRYAPEWGWRSAPTLAGFGVSLLLLLSFVIRQRAAGDRALVPSSLLAHHPRLVLALLGEALLGQAYFAVIGLGPQLFTNVLNRGSITAGLMLAPSMLAFSVAAALTSRSTELLRGELVVLGAGAVAALGALLLAVIPDNPSYASMLPGLLLVGLGTGCLFSSLVTIGVGEVPEQRRGLAAGLLYVAQLAGGAIGLGAITAIVTAVAAGTAGSEALALVHGARTGFAVAAGVGGLGLIVITVGYGRVTGEARRTARSGRRPPVGPAK